ncbi:PQQ-binding-like beta-propeller repeat protein [Streptomyces sp. Ag109_O5-10]|uniref:protein kinase domain-containing protein n=1 Tax=Streptomyces sp. Ag109_O5-10 TaxID=1855349 RepID=UPI00089BA4B0|nr:PQQ-binding-like beta-propeller repeat protein [Streptomyces sp. Ag109_O5-10]SEF09799.1 Serine/threonine protein kinase [Streptomyces sp. Ag109_O5-10]
MPLHKNDPRSLGGYKLADRLGAGGMGIVYRGRSRSGREVAVKVVHARYAEDPVFRARFRQEIEAARRVSGAFTAPVLDADPDAPAPWMATQYVPGPSLAARIRAHGALRLTELRPLALGLVEALRDIHRAGVVHRDLKPANVLMAEDGPRVIDFGISRAAENHNTLTETGQMVGTPPFMSPEQFTDARTAGPASDVFSLGALLVYCVTGRGPFDADSPYLTGYRVVHNEPVLDGVTGPLRAVLERCLAKDPDARPGLDDLAREFAAALPEPSSAEPQTMTLRLPATRPGRHAPAADAATPPVTGRRSRGTPRVLLAAAAVTALALTGYFLLQGPGNSDGEASTGSATSPGSRWAALPTGWRPWQTTVSATAGQGVRKAPGYEGDTSPSCVSDGSSVYCGGTSLLPTRVDATTGRTLWRAGIAPAGVPADRYITTVLGVDDGQVLVELQITDENGAGRAQSVMALDGKDGSGVWSHPVRTDSLGAAYGDGVTLTQEGDGSTFTVRSARDGSVRSTVPVPRGWLCSMLSAGDFPYADCGDQTDGSHATRFYVVHPADGSVRTLDSPAQTASFVGILSGQLLFLESDDQDVENGPDLIYHRIVRVDPGTGKRTLTPLPEKYRGGLPTLAHGTLFLATSSGLVTAFSPTTGARLWASHTTLESPGQASVDAQGRTVYMAGMSGRVVALDAAKGTVLWESSARAEVLGNSGLLPTVWFNRGALVLSTSDGTVFTLDPAHPERKPVDPG